MNRHSTRWDILAALRFVLAWIVACGHVTYFFTDTNGLTRQLAEFGGKAAVTGFLLVSGYSIAASLERRQTQFYRRRLMRIYPLFLFAVLLGYGLELAVGGHVAMPSGAELVGTGPLTALGNVFLTQTFLVKPMSFDAPLWSLSVEFAYYLAAPILRRLDRRVLLGLIVLSAASYLAPRRDDLGVLYLAFSRFNALEYAWAWVMGFYVYQCRSRAMLAAFVAGGTALVMLNTYLNPEAYASLTFLVSFGLIVCASSAWLNRRRTPYLSRVLDYLGNVSYPLYLLQYPAFIIASHYVGMQSGFMALGFCTLFAIGAYHGIDVYLKRLIVDARRKPAVADDAASGLPGRSAAA